MPFDNAKQKNALTLAYLGDAVYELLVREYLTAQSGAGPAALHRLAVSAVSANAQCAALEMIRDMLTEEEKTVARRGRNASRACVPRNTAPKAYRAATGLEALFGYLSMCGRGERIRELFAVSAVLQLDAALERRNVTRAEDRAPPDGHREEPAGC